MLIDDWLLGELLDVETVESELVELLSEDIELTELIEVSEVELELLSELVGDE